MPEPIEEPIRPNRAEDGGARVPPAADVPADDAPPATGDRPAAVPGAWHRLARDFLRPGRGQALVALVLCLVSAAIIVQVRHKPDDTYSSMRRSDLVQLLDQLNSEQSRLDDEVTRLERTKQQLASGADAQRVAQQEANKRLDQLRILNGTAPAVGPGIRLTILDPQRKVTAALMVDAVEELRDAGAEAMQVNGRVRVVASTWFVDRDGQVVADGVVLQPPYVLEAIGEPHALDEGARFRGGIVSEVQSSDVGGQALLSRLDRVQVTSIHQATTQQWARPA